MRYWWVNQYQTYPQEIQGGHLWCPKQNANGARAPIGESRRAVTPGDLIFSFKGTKIFPIGIAQTVCTESPKPIEFVAAGQNWKSISWRFERAFAELLNMIGPKDQMVVLRSFLPKEFPSQPYPPRQAQRHVGQVFQLCLHDRPVYKAHGPLWLRPYRQHHGLCRRGSSPHPSGRQLDHCGFYVRQHSLGQCLCQMRCASQLHQPRPGLGSALARAPASLGPAPQHHTCDLKGHLDMRVPRCSNFAKYPLRLSETIRRSGIKME